MNNRSPRKCTCCHNTSAGTWQWGGSIASTSWTHTSSCRGNSSSPLDTGRSRCKTRTEPCFVLRALCTQACRLLQVLAWAPLESAEAEVQVLGPVHRSAQHCNSPTMCPGKSGLLPHTNCRRCRYQGCNRRWCISVRHIANFPYKRSPSSSWPHPARAVPLVSARASARGWATELALASVQGSARELL